jgi:hypothetical protein
MPDLPIICTLSPDALLTRRDELAALVRSAAVANEIPGGMRFRFAATDEVLPTLARVVEAERQCCRFLRFAITVEPDGGPIGLEVTGPAGTREFVAALLAAE